jgi:[ribosomal protein S18]-alanine N-acetyltransferase
VTPDSQPPAFTIRAYRPISEDAAFAAALLRESKGAAPWPESTLQPASFATASTFAFFCEHAGKPTGFIIGRQAAEEAEILNLAVSTSSRRQGQAKALVERLLLTFREHSVLGVFLEVRESNSAAITLYEKLGFRLVGRRPSYYREPIEAALLYSKLLDSTG